MAGPEATQLPSDSARCNEPTALELDLKGLSFREKWETIGTATPAAFLRAEAPPSPLTGWNHDAKQFQGMVGSVKLNNCDLVRRSAVRAAASFPALPNDVRRQMKYLKEAGSPFRVHCKANLGASEEYQKNDGSIARPDHVGNVEQGMEDMFERYESRHDLAHPPSQPSSPLRLSATSRRSLSMSRRSLRASMTKASPMNAMAVMVTLSEFSRWCIDNFSDSERAWNTLNPAGDAKMNKDDFLQALRRCGYPQWQEAHEELFKCLTDGEAMTEQSFNDAVDSVSVGRTCKRVTTAHFKSSTGSLGMMSAASAPDPIEALAVGDTDSGSSLKKRQKDILERLRRNDAPVAEAIQYFFENFGTLKLAFQQLDINGNGLLSTQEFVDGLIGLRSKNTAGPIKVHMQQLFARLDFPGKGSIPLEDLVSNLEKDADPMVARLLKFTQEVKRRSGRKTDESKSPKSDDAAKLRQYVRMLKVGHATSPVTLEGFCDALYQLKYPTWHAVELFRRLDKDDSGALSLGEFTAFLQKEPPVRCERKGPVKPLGNEFRKNQVEQMYMSSANSCKLESERKASDPQASPLNKLLSRGNAENNKFLLMGLDQDGGKERPNWLHHVREGLMQSREDRSGSRFAAPKATELSRLGSHVLRVHSQSAPDLSSKSCATAYFNEHEDRCRISAF